MPNFGMQDAASSLADLDDRADNLPEPWPNSTVHYVYCNKTKLKQASKAQF
jgi:hypothetical protein